MPPPASEPDTQWGKGLTSRAGYWVEHEIGTSHCDPIAAGPRPRRLQLDAVVALVQLGKVEIDGLIEQARARTRTTQLRASWIAWTQNATARPVAKGLSCTGGARRKACAAGDASWAADASEHEC